MQHLSWEKPLQCHRSILLVLELTAHVRLPTLRDFLILQKPELETLRGYFELLVLRLIVENVYHYMPQHRKYVCIMQHHISS